MNAARQTANAECGGWHALWFGLMGKGLSAPESESEVSFLGAGVGFVEDRLRLSVVRTRFVGERVVTVFVGIGVSGMGDGIELLLGLIVRSSVHCDVLVLFRHLQDRAEERTVRSVWWYEETKERLTLG